MPQQLEALRERHDVERQFHDEKAASAHNSDQRNFYSAGGVDSIWRAYWAALGDIQGKSVLDFGCGEGWSTLAYARNGAAVYSFDISSESVRNLIHDATRAGVASCIHPAVMAAEALGYPDEAFDLVLGVSILHHVDLDCVGAEIARVLKPGGRALFIEPLSHNWLLQLFRWLTPARRTPTEQPMSVEQIQQFGKHFGEARFQGHALLSTFSQGLLWATGSKWIFLKSLLVTEAIDQWLLRFLPFLQRYCWSAIIEVRK
ncbi:MAG: class I SAM-dependent methyltransferase [Deltaproteobacteria bacterium]|nr:class I SAM-dependent methyltransferase [Deltaproteobacteria bacterium]